MEIKILQVFYDKNGLPYKDKERTVHYPITSGTFLGASNTTQIRFYYDQLDELNESTFVAVSKLPNGKIGSEILESEYDSELQENYAILNLSSFYTQYKGDVYISLQGYQGGVKVEQDENGIYQIYGTPTIQATGSIKLSIAYAPTFIGSGQTENITLQRVLAELSTKLGIRQETLHVEELPTIGNPNVWYVVNDDPNDTTKANIYIWNATTQTYVWVGDNTLDLGNYYTQEQGEQFESDVDNRVTSVENELSSVASGSPKGVYATLSDLETAFPTGDSHIYLVGTDWYYWNTTNEEWTSGGTYLASTEDEEQNQQIDYLLSNKEKLLIKNGLYQYLDNDNIIDDYIWNSSNGDEPSRVAVSDFHCFPVFVLGKGTYCFPIAALYGEQSYIKNSNGVQKFSDAFPSVGYGGVNNYFEITEPTEMYISTTSSLPYLLLVDYNAQTSTLNYYELTNHSKQYLKGDLNDNIKINEIELVKDDISSQKNQIDTLFAEKEKNIIENGLYQYLDNSNIVDNYIWNSNDGAQPSKVSASNFHCFEMFILPKGRYVFPLASLFGDQSYIKNSNGVRKFSTVYPTVGYGGTDYYFDIDEPTEMYISVTTSLEYLLLTDYNNQVSTIDWFNLADHSKGYLKGQLNNNIDVVGKYYQYDQFYIKNCELTCNDDNLNEDGASAKYVKVNLGNTAKIARCRIKFKNPSNTYRSCAAIIFTNYDTNDYIGDIVEHSIHCTFTQTMAYVEIFDNRVLTDLATYSYDTLTPDVEYEIGIKVENSTLTIYLPNGTTQTVTDARLATFNGKYVIFESYNSLVENPGDIPTDNFEHPIFTGLYAVPVNDGLALRDNFLRADGALQVAPTGHVYNCYRNISQNDDRYDSAGNRILD